MDSSVSNSEHLNNEKPKYQMQTVLVCQNAHLTLDFEFKTNTQDCLGLMSFLINYNKWKDEDELSTYLENVYLA